MIPSAVPGDHHTTTALSDSRLNEIRSVQPGCWYSGQWMVRHPDGNTGRVEIVHTDSFGDTVIARMPDFLDGMAHFLVDARTAVPELLAEVERLRAELATARAATFHEAADAVMQASHGEPLRDAYSAYMRAHGLLHRLAQDATPAACTCGAEPAHQHGCDAGQ